LLVSELVPLPHPLGDFIALTDGDASRRDGGRDLGECSAVVVQFVLEDDHGNVIRDGARVEVELVVGVDDDVAHGDGLR